MGLVEHIAHDGCENNSSDGLAVYQDNEGKHTGFCWSCGTYVADPYKDGRVPPKAKIGKTPEQIAAEMAEIGTYPVVALPERKLELWALDYFGIKIGLSEYDGHTPAFHYYPYHKGALLSAYKTRMIEGKRMWAVGTMKGVDPFGWQQAIASGAKTLYITEGELDAVALYQALKAKNKGSAYEHHNPAVVSLINGAGSAKQFAVDHHQAITSNFKNVVLVFDHDEPGDGARREFLSVLPAAKTVTLPGKDANDCLMRGKALALCSAVLFKADTPKNTRVINASTLFEAARKPAEWGLSWPWEGLTKLTRGIRFGETYYLGAGVKMGKSEMVNAIGSHLVIEHGLSVLMAKPEEANAKTVKLMAGKVAGRIFHDPEIEFDNAAYDEATKKIGEKLWLLNLYQHMGWESLRADILGAISAGCKAVFIDPITNLTNGIASGEANTILQGFAQELAAMALDHNVVMFIFCHLKAPESGDSHERGGKVYSSQFAGSRAMMRSCNLMLGLEGNKDPDIDPEIRNMRKLVVLEDREFGASGYLRLYWNPKTSLFTEIQEKK